MSRTLITGGLLAIVTSILLLLGHDTELEGIAVLSACLGAVLGLVPDRVTVGRYIGFLTGFAFAWMGFAIRAALLPDTAGGRAVAALVVLALATVVTVATLRRVPLWSQLLGIATLVGAYEHVYAAAPARFLTESPSTATTALLAAGLGMLAGSLVTQRKDAAKSERDQEQTAQVAAEHEADQDPNNPFAQEPTRHDQGTTGDDNTERQSAGASLFGRPRRGGADGPSADTDQTAPRAAGTDGEKTRLNDLMGMDR